MSSTSATSATPFSLPQLGALGGPVARGLFSLPLAISGVTHLVAAGPMAAAVPAWVPGGILWVYLTGIALLAGAVGIHLRRFAPAAGLGLAVLLLVFAFTVHLPAMANPAMQQFATASFFKDVALAGGALAMATTHRT